MSFTPEWATPPGTTIARACEDKGLSLITLCRMLGTDRLGLESGDFVIDSCAALTLSAFVGSSKEFWERRERQYRESLESQGVADKSERSLRSAALYAHVVAERYSRLVESSEPADAMRCAIGEAEEVVRVWEEAVK